LIPNPLDINVLHLSAKVIGKEAIRYTPAGIAVVKLTLEHQGMQSEAGAQRQVQFEMTAHVLGQAAKQAQVLQLGQVVRVQGFLAPTRKGAKQLRLHITHIESN
jgi:primosomal replication protein N